MTSQIPQFQLARQALARCPRIALADARRESRCIWGSKVASLLQFAPIRSWLASDHWLARSLVNLSAKGQVAALSLIAIGQDHLVANNPQKIADGEKKWRAFLACLEHTEAFYADIGGIIGYHVRVLDLLVPAMETAPPRYFPPPTFDWSDRSWSIESAVHQALLLWHKMALIIPAGGAGDRLDLRHPVSHEPLPAAFLELDGVSLLEGIARDLRGIELLAERATGLAVETPIAIMTSAEKGNHELIARYLRQRGWFGRSKESFRLFCQDSVPVVNAEGRWVSRGPLEVLTKPGGHGVLWRLAKWFGIFDWLRELGREKALVRQINNPLAGSDIGPLALVGLGWQLNKPLGFASCERIENMAEGVNALVERPAAEGFSYSIENIEYNALPSALSQAGPRGYLANVNQLFVDLTAVEALAAKSSLPGLMINFKPCGGAMREGQPAGRLESTLQAIASQFTRLEERPRANWQPDELPQFALTGPRDKSLSAAKRANGGFGQRETPLSAYLDVQRNYRALLRACGFGLPAENDVASAGPPQVVIALHPALGPDHGITAQKLRGGSLGVNSELRLEIENFDCANLQLRGSLIVECLPSDGAALPCELEGSCTLRDISVENAGVIPSVGFEFWRAPPERAESLHIALHGSSEVIARDITLRGSHRIDVPAGYRALITAIDGNPRVELQPLTAPPTKWKYHWISHHCALEREAQVAAPLPRDHFTPEAAFAAPKFAGPASETERAR